MWHVKRLNDNLDEENKKKIYHLDEIDNYSNVWDKLNQLVIVWHIDNGRVTWISSYQYFSSIILMMLVLTIKLKNIYIE